MNVIRPSRAEPDLAREVAAHLAMMEDDFARRGLSPDEARVAARRAFGGVEQTKDWHRDARSFVWLDDAHRDVQYAARSLRRTPGFTLVAIVTLALGIGANTAIFSVVHAVLLQPLPFAHADRLVRAYEDVPASETPNHQAQRIGGVNVSDWLELRTRSRALSHVVSYGVSLVTPVDTQVFALLQGAAVSADTFSMLGVQPTLGRWFLPSEEASGDHVLILSHDAWRTYFNGDSNVIGKMMRFTGNTSFGGGLALGAAYTVVGVMPAGFHFPLDNEQFWFPLVVTAPTDGRPHRIVLMGTLAAGVSIEAAISEMNTLLYGARGGTALLPADAPGPPRFELVRVQDEVAPSVRPALIVLSVAVGFVLLIACANVANLLLARTAARQREIAVRIAIGASRGRLVRQTLTESLMLALLGGVAGTALALAGVHAFRSLATNLSRFDLGAAVAFPRVDQIAVDGPALAFAVCISATTGLLFGLAPALSRSRADPMEPLRDGTAPTAHRGFLGGVRAQRVLVVSEIAVATLLFIAGALLMRSFISLASVDPGYDAAHALTFQVALRGDRYPPARLQTFADNVVARLQGMPDVEAAAYARQLPLVNLQDTYALRRRQPDDPPSPEGADARFVSPDYLKAMGIRVIAGRMFDEADRASHPRAMVINQTLARREFPDRSPIGQPIYAGPDRSPWEIIGVFDDVKQFGLDRAPQPQFFADLTQWSGSARNLFPVGPYFAVRLRGDHKAFVSNALTIVRQLDADAALYNVATMEEIVSNSMTLPRMYAALLGVFAAIAVALAAIGIYGMMAYAVTQRTREIGIRMALGAQRATVLKLVLTQGAFLTAVGIALGLAGAIAMTRYLQNLLFGLTPLDPPTFVAVALAFTSVAMLASYVPARRATTVDPLVALRHE
ncbi:MAG TPA: ABC transporter permease [Vicinamibacterales bacterium]|nr:ABC transporter permease [Vicinamibacterales bacterium]